MRKITILTAAALIGIFCFSFGCSGERCIECGTVVHKTVLEGVNFEFDKADLLPSAYPVLDKDIKILANDPKLNVSIEGHCDIRGTDEYNQRLSERRAKAVFNYFASKGISKKRMRAVGFGRSRPLVPNTSEENMAKNRRVEVKVIEPDK
jgi:OOP family OmpA-OmpF porin